MRANPKPDVLLELADRLLDQRDEPGGSESDRLHYWRDKAIEVGRALRSRAKDARATLKESSK